PLVSCFHMGLEDVQLRFIIYIKLLPVYSIVIEKGYVFMHLKAHFCGIGKIASCRPFKTEISFLHPVIQQRIGPEEERVETRKTLIASFIVISYQTGLNSETLIIGGEIGGNFRKQMKFILI